MKVDVQDVGTIEFPDEATPQEISSFLNKNFSKNPLAEKVGGGQPVSASKIDISPFNRGVFQPSQFSSGMIQPTSENPDTALTSRLSSEFPGDVMRFVPEQIENVGATILNAPATLTGQRPVFTPGKQAIPAPDKTPITNPNQSPFLQGVVDSIATQLTGMTTPGNIATLGAGSGMGKVSQEAATIGNKLLATYFGGEMVSALPDAAKNAIGVFKDPNSTAQDKGNALATVGGAAGLATLLIKHAGKVEPTRIPDYNGSSLRLAQGALPPEEIPTVALDPQTGNPIPPAAPKAVTQMPIERDIKTFNLDEPVAETPLNSGGSQTDLPPELQAQSKSNNSRAAFEALAREKGTTLPPSVITTDSLPTGENANDVTWYHGGKKLIDSPSSTFSKINSLFGNGFYMTDSPDIARTYAKENGVVHEVKVKINKALNFENKLPDDAASIIKNSVYDDFKPIIEEAIKKGTTGSELWKALTTAVEEQSHGDMIPISEYVEMFQAIEGNLKDAGYDAITHIGGTRAGKGKVLHRVLILLDPSSEYSNTRNTVSSIKELKPTLPVQEQSPLSVSPEKTTLEPVQVPSTRGEDVLHAAVEKKLIENLSELPTHEQMNVKSEVAKAIDFIKSNPEEALKISKGENVQSGVRPEAVYTALEEKAIRDGDVKTLHELSNSPLPTQAGQSLKLLDSTDPNSPVKIMRDIRQSRESFAEKRTKTTKDRVVKDIKTTIRRVASKRQTWEEVVAQLMCN